MRHRHRMATTAAIAISVVALVACGGETPAAAPSASPSDPTSSEPATEAPSTAVPSAADRPPFDPQTRSVVTDPEPGSFSIVVARPNAQWVAGEPETLDLLVDATAGWDPEWDARFLEVIEAATADGPVRSVLTSPVGPGGRVVTWTVEADPIEDGVTARDWYGSDAKARFLPPPDGLVSGHAIPDGDDEAAAVFVFADEVFLVRVVVDREFDLAWRASVSIPVSDSDHPLVAEIAATLPDFATGPPGTGEE